MVKPIRKSHITFISESVEDSLWNEFILKFQNKKIKFWLDPTLIRSNGKHWWICVESEKVEILRTSLGLEPQPFFKLHLTIGLSKDVDNELEKNSLFTNYLKKYENQI